MKLTIELEQEVDGRWIAEVLEISGVMVYGDTQAEAIRKVQSLALSVIADQIAHGEIEVFDALTFAHNKAA